MKSFLKTFICLTLITAFLFTGCDTTDASSDMSSDVSEATPEISPEDLALAEKAAVDFGILHNAEIWGKAEDIKSSLFDIWYHYYISNTLTYEERVELYSPKDFEHGWEYPQEELEAYVQKYFNVSAEHLRSSSYYVAETGTYLLDYIGGANLSYEVRLSETKPTLDGDIMYIPMELSFLGEEPVKYRTLVIQKTEDGFKYLESRYTTEKVDFVGFSMLVPKDMKVENFTIFHNPTSDAEFIKLLDVRTKSGLADLILYAEKEYKESEYFISESIYVADNIWWKEYTLKIPLPEESGLDQTETYSYYLIEAGGKAILMQTSPLISGAGSHREEIENILKTIE